MNVYNDTVLKIVGNLEMEDSITRFTWALAAHVHQDNGQKVRKNFIKVSKILKLIILG